MIIQNAAVSHQYDVTNKKQKRSSPLRYPEYTQSNVIVLIARFGGESYKLLRVAALQKKLFKTNLVLFFKKRHINMANNLHRELIAVERKCRNWTSNSLLYDNYKIQSLSNGFDTQETLPTALSEEKVRKKKKGRKKSFLWWQIHLVLMTNSRRRIQH